MLTQDDIKQKLGIFAADFIKQDMTIGLGTGTTVYYLLKELGKRKKEKIFHETNKLKYNGYSDRRE